MRKRSKNKDISVHAIAGMEVVLLGLNATPKAAAGLLGFHILRRKGKTGPFKPLSGGQDFADFKSPVPVIQAFLWGDYVVDPKTTYTYRVTPVYGQPDAMKQKKSVDVTITTEDPEDKTHAVYFNRGVAGSQAYSRRFGKHRKIYKVDQNGREVWRDFIKPASVPNRAAHKWLSRGLEEAMLGFIAQAKGPEYSIRAAVYELTYAPAVQAFVDALERGVDVKIIHHAKRTGSMRLKRNREAKVEVTYSDGETDPAVFKSRDVVKEETRDSVCKAADATVKEIGLANADNCDAFDQMMIERTITQISHNKFIVLLKNDKPIQVWTGSTNFTEGGIFGQSNVGHVVRDAKVAESYLAYWEKLSADPKKRSSKADAPDKGLANWTVLHQPDLKGAPPPNSITPVFSPRLTPAMLEWYADRLAAAKSSVHFTAAFSVADEIFAKVVKKKRVDAGQPYVRYLLLEGITGLLRPKYPAMAKCPQNRIAWGDTLHARKGGEQEHHQFLETLTGLNSHVSYLHTKYMLIDPLSDDPVVITGSANFSKASTVNNDENMLVIRGSTRVADMFLGEFMRLFRHFRYRNVANGLSDEAADVAAHLAPDDSWTKQYYSDGDQKKSERLLFS